MGAAARTYIETVKDRVVGGYDIGVPTVGEAPAALLDLFRAAAVTPAPHGPPTEDDAAFFSESVPPAKHKEAAIRLAEARHGYRMRDERALYQNRAETTENDTFRQ